MGIFLKGTPAYTMKMGDMLLTVNHFLNWRMKAHDYEFMWGVKTFEAGNSTKTRSQEHGQNHVLDLFL